MTDAATYQTTNFYEAAFCLLKGLKLKGRDPLGKKTLIRLEGEHAKEIAESYYDSDFKKYIDCYKTIKDYGYRDQSN